MEKITPQQATAIVQLHHWSNECLNKDVVPIVMLGIKKLQDKIEIVALVQDGAVPEDILVLLKNAYEGMKAQINTTPSGIIKSITSNG
jgi:hypothetical protein